MTGTPTRPLADLRISPIGLGGNVFGWTADEATSFDVLDAYVDAGGNLVDTADGYSYWAPGNSGGESETVIGSWLASRPVRDRIVLATKVSTKPDRSGLSADNIDLALEESLSRLRTDVVDIYYAHFDDESVPLEETVAAFEDARRAGKIRHVGLSNYTPERIRQWFAIADSQGSARPIVLQPHYNLLHRDDVEGPGLRGQVAAELGMGLMPYFALAAGFLTGSRSTVTAPGWSPTTSGLSATTSLTPSSRWQRITEWSRRPLRCPGCATAPASPLRWPPHAT